MYIDSHHHFWKLSRGDYTWMSPDYKEIYKDFDETDLLPFIIKNDITKTVIVQAADSIAETDFILEIAERAEFVSGVVGWVDFENTQVKLDIDRLSSNPYLKGFRPMIHDIRDEDWMLKEQLSFGLNYLSEKNLTFDALVRPNHLKNLYIFAKRYKNLSIVIDHIAKPKIMDGEIDQWMFDLRKLSELENIFCKFSGILTEVSSRGERAKISPYVEHVFSVFETNRIMWGSDWPVLELAEKYDDWFNLANKFCASLSESEKMDVFANTAASFYRL